MGAAYAGPLCGILCLLVLHLPGLLLIHAALPHWLTIRSSPHVATAIRAVHPLRCQPNPLDPVPSTLMPSPPPCTPLSSLHPLLPPPPPNQQRACPCLQVSAASSGLAIATTLHFFAVASTPPQQAVTILTYATVHAGYLSRVAPSLPPAYHPPLTIALAATISLPLTIPWILTEHAHTPTHHTATHHTITSQGEQGSSSASATAAAATTVADCPTARSAIGPPPPPSPSPPDPSPPPPPSPGPPEPSPPPLDDD